MPAESGRFSLVKENVSSSLLELSALDEDTELELFGEELLSALDEDTELERFWEELLSALDEDTELELFWEELLSALDEISLFELEGIFPPPFALHSAFP